MCGRFSIIKQQLELEHYFHKEMPAGYRGPNYNVAPTENVPVITKDGFEIMRWGLVPQWAKSMSSGYNMINAVGETLSDKPKYRGL
jgi:putative SOS response-associated peptidase YedK